MSFVYHTESYQGLTIKIVSDDDPMNPRKKFDNVGTMVCWHRQYELGDKQMNRDTTPNDYFTGLAREVVSSNYPEHLLRANLNKILAAHYVVLDLYLYDHSGITMSTSPFSCPWDSGQVGFIHVSLKKAFEEWGREDQKAKGWDGLAAFTNKEDGSPRTLREAATCYLEGEVETYDQYLTNSVYGYVIEDSTGDSVESCYGFFQEENPGSSKSYVLQEARSMAKACVQHVVKKHAEQLKAWIRNHVPLEQRKAFAV